MIANLKEDLVINSLAMLILQTQTHVASSKAV